MVEIHFISSKILPATPIGALSLFASPAGLVQIAFGRLPETPATDSITAGLLDQAVQQLGEYFSGTRREFTLPLDCGGSSNFQAAVLQACAPIPYGSVRSYGELASSVGSPKAARAVGMVMAGNPLPIIIPCHRVIGSDRKLRGYAAPSGLEAKAWLLRLEGHTIAAEKLV